VSIGTVTSQLLYEIADPAYLGPDVPADDLVASVRPAGARVVVLGVTRVAVVKATERELRAVVRDLPRDVELWVGGRGAARYASALPPRGRIGLETSNCPRWPIRGRRGGDRQFHIRQAVYRGTGTDMARQHNTRSLPG